MSRIAAPVVRAEASEWSPDRACPEALAQAFLEWSRRDPRRWTTAFLAWADSRRLSEPLRREVRVAVLRARNFGREARPRASE